MPKHRKRGASNKAKKAKSKQRPKRRSDRPDTAATAAPAAPAATVGTTAVAASAASCPPPPPPPPPASVASVYPGAGVGAGVGAGCGAGASSSSFVSTQARARAAGRLPLGSTSLSAPTATATEAATATAADVAAPLCVGESAASPPAPPAPPMHRSNSHLVGRSSRPVPDEIAVSAFMFLDAESVAACRCVNHQWRGLATSPFLWRALCRQALRQHSAAAAALLKESLSSCSSWMVAYPRIPQVRFNGVYHLKHEYIRKSYINDRFHEIPPGGLRVRFHRTFLFRPDGTLAYCMMPGDISESLRVIKRRTHPDVHVGSYSLHGHELRAQFSSTVGSATTTHMWLLTFDVKDGATGVVDRSALRCVRQEVQGTPISAGQCVNDFFRYLPVVGL